MAYNGYNESRKNSTIKYMKERIKTVNLHFVKDDFDERIKPAIDRSGLKVATFMKQAIDEKIERDGLG